MTSFRHSGVENAAGRVGELSQTVPIDAIVHERAPPLRDDKAHLTQDFQVVRDRWLAQRKVIGDVADTDGFLACREEVEDANASGIGEGLEPGGVGFGISGSVTVGVPGGVQQGCSRMVNVGRSSVVDMGATPSYGQSIVHRLMFVNT